MIPEAIAHAMREYPRESCGLIVMVGGEARYIECNNISEEDDGFIIDPEDFILADATGEIVGVVHSHPDSPALPSKHDLLAQQATGVPWHIISVPGGNWHTFGDN